MTDHGSQLFTQKTCILFIMISFSLLMAYLLPKTVYNTIITNFSILSSSWQRSEEQSSSYYRISMPCIEPHCEIQCSVTYDSHEKDGIIRRESLTPIQQEHLMIDLGRDTIVQKLINSAPSYKLCQSSYLPTKLL
jgi:hypothetical protein